MENSIKKSVAILLAYIIKVDNRDVEKETSLFCSIMGQEFSCSQNEALRFLKDALENNYNLYEHIDIINQALKNNKIAKMHLLEQLNHMIYSDKISQEDYKIFEKIKKRLFPDINI